MRCVCTAIVLGTLTVAVSPAQAGARDITVTKKLETLTIDIAPGRPVVLMFKSEIVEWKAPPRWKVRVTADPTLSTIELLAPQGTSARQMAAGKLLVATRAFTLYVHVRAATRPDPDEAYNINHADLVSLCDAHDAQEIAEQLDRELTKRDAEHAEELAAARIEHQRALAELEIRQAHEVLTATEQTLLREASYTSFLRVPLDGACEGDSIAICPHAFVNSEERGVLGVWVHNRSGQELKIAQAQVVDLATEVDHAASFLVTDERDQPVTVIEPGARVKVSVLVREPKLMGDNVRVVLGGASPVLPAVRQTHIPNMWDWADQEREKQAEERRQRERERQAKRVSVHVTGSYGAIWLPAGADAVDDAEATSLKGLGVRVTKGLHPNWAVSVDVTGAASGRADFGQVTVDGMDGVLTRSVKTGGITFGGNLRLGERIIPILRLGIGLQVVSRDSTMVTIDGPIHGIEDRTELIAIGTFGAGVDLRLSTAVTAGVEISFVAPRDEELFQQAFEGGVHLSYAWIP